MGVPTDAPAWCLTHDRTIELESPAYTADAIHSAFSEICPEFSRSRGTAPYTVIHPRFAEFTITHVGGPNSRQPLLLCVRRLEVPRRPRAQVE